MTKRLIGGAGVITAAALAGSMHLAAQSAATAAGQQLSFRVRIDAITMDAVVRDAQGRFVSDLTKDEFEIYEDGVKQDVTSMSLSLGGRITDVVPTARPALAEGIILPARPARSADAPGRIFLFFVDDLHLQVEHTPRLHALFTQISSTLVHQGDLVGVIERPSAIQLDYTYDAKRLVETINRIAGHGLPPNDIIQSGQGMHGVAELRLRAQVVLSTMHDALADLARMQNRRKALIWVSEGYDFTPFRDSRLGQGDPNNFFQQNLRNFQRSHAVSEDGSHQQVIDPLVETQMQNELFADADLGAALRRLTAEANGVNATIYTIDPRGLVAGQPIEQQVNPAEWNDYVLKTQETMREIAERTGGVAVVAENDFARALKRIDAEASDYYLLGYSSRSAEAAPGSHRIEVRVTRPGLTVQSRSEYRLAKPSK